MTTTRYIGALAALAVALVLPVAACTDGPAIGSPCSVHELDRERTAGRDVLRCVADPNATGGYAWTRVGRTN